MGIFLNGKRDLPKKSGPIERPKKENRLFGRKTKEKWENIIQ
jgi:hypothetical protein